jgi:hypothetical protein
MDASAVLTDLGVLHDLDRGARNALQAVGRAEFPRNRDFRQPRRGLDLDQLAGAGDCEKVVRAGHLATLAGIRADAGRCMLDVFTTARTSADSVRVRLVPIFDSCWKEI